MSGAVSRSPRCTVQPVKVSTKSTSKLEERCDMPRSVRQNAAVAKPDSRCRLMQPVIRAMTPADAANTSAMLGQHFPSSSVLHRALNIEAAQWQGGDTNTLLAAAASGCSVVATHPDNTTLLGCVVAWALDNGHDKPSPHTDATDPISALLQALRQAAPAPLPGKTVHIDMAVVTPSARGRGLYRRMRETVHAQSRALGYTRLRGELSSAATQHVCLNHFGHRMLSEVHYASFECRNARPFATVHTPPSIQLVEGHV